MFHILMLGKPMSFHEKLQDLFVIIVVTYLAYLSESSMLIGRNNTKIKYANDEYATSLKYNLTKELKFNSQSFATN